MKVAESQPGELITMLRKHSRSIAIFLIIFASLIVDSCSYYKKKILSTDQISIDDINKNLAKGKQFVLVTRAKTWEADNVKLIDEKSLNMNLRTIRPTSMLADKLGHLRYSSKNRVKHGDELLQQLVIMHLRDDGSLGAGNLNLAIADIAKIEVYNPNVTKSVLVVVIPVAVVFGLFALAGSAAAKSVNSASNSSSSCPFLYAYNGNEFQLAAETFGGAIYPGLERSDFVALPMALSEKGYYQFKIRNELKERQYINKVRFIEAKIPGNKSLNIDQHGVIHTIGTPILPSSAVSDSGQDYTSEVTISDSSQFYFNDGEIINSLTLNFDKPVDVRSGKLLLKTKNTLWLDYVFGEFLQLFGLYYNTFADMQKLKTKEQMGQWSQDQNLPLTVSIYNAGEWVEVEQLPPIGPLAAARDVVIPINLSDINEESLKVKLSTGYYFWEVDYAAMDYTPDEPIETKYAIPTVVELNTQVVSNGALNDDDSLYVVQNYIGDELDLTFATQFNNDSETMVFLEVSGYYTHLRNFKTLPEFETLKTFRNPGRLSEFSRELLYNYSVPVLAKNVVNE